MADSPLDPDAIARKTFLAGFRGYEQQEVRAYLHDLAQQARRATTRLAEAEARLVELEPLADELDAPIDPSRLAQLVGEETARVLEAARAAADEITSKAEDAAARVIRDATAEAQALRQAADDDARAVRDEADQLLARRAGEAEAAADEIIGRAERDAATKREDAEADHARAVAETDRLTAESTEQAERIVEEAKAHGRSIVAEARALRQNVLEDLGRRRQVARAQVARLDAGRERLLAAYETVRISLDEATGELTTSVGEARAAADTAALRIKDETVPTAEELEAELGITIDADLVDAWADEPEFDIEPESDDTASPAAPPSAGVESASGPEPAGRANAGPVAIAASPGSGSAPVVTTDELPEIDADLDPSPVEDPPDPIVLPRKSPKRRLLRRDEESAATMLPPAELVPLTERHAVEGVRLVGPDTAGESPRDDEADGAGDAAIEPEVRGAPEAVEVPAATAERVDALFARIRAERAEATGQANDLLDAVDAVTTDAVEDQADEPADDLSDEGRLALTVMGERDEALDPLGRELGKRLKRALADEQNELLDALRRSGDDDVLSHLPDPQSHFSLYVAAAGSVLGEAAEAGARATDESVTETPETTVIARSMAEAICTPLRDRFEHAREEAAGDLDELDTRLRACYREWKTTVLGAVGEDALVAAWSAGVVAATPAGCGLRWLVAPGSAPCPDADDNALEGVIEPGAVFPTGDVHPPAHPGCRCMVVPVNQ